MNTYEIHVIYPEQPNQVFKISHVDCNTLRYANKKYDHMRQVYTETVIDETVDYYKKFLAADVYNITVKKVPADLDNFYE